MPEPAPPFARRPAEIDAADTPGVHGLLFVVVAVVVVAGLYFGRTVLIPITLAMLLSFVLAPLANLFRRLYLGRIGSVLIAVVLALTIILALGGLIGSQLAALAEEVPRYAYTIHRKVDTLQKFVASHLSNLTLSLGTKPEPAPTAGKGRPGGGLNPRDAAPGSPEPQKPVQVEVHEPDPSAMELARRIVTPVVEPLSTTVIVLIVSIFVLLQREDLRDRMIRLFGSSDLHRTTLAMNEAAARLSRFFLIQLAVNAGFGVIIAAGLAFLGIPSPVMWGIFGMLLRFVPYIGAPLSALMPLTLAAAIDPNWSLLVWTAGLYLVSEVILGQFLEPLVYGHSTGLSSFAVVVSATFWTWLWGPIGLLLSTPLTLCLVVLGRHVPLLEFLDVLLGDRPALTPVESFYQRMLAGDPDEAVEQAELLLKEQSLLSYYDKVALPALRLAAADAERGALTPVYLARVKASIRSLIEDLEDHEEDAPDQAGDAEAGAVPAVGGLGALPRTETAGSMMVLCVAGRGWLDEEASAILAQLLEREGLTARVVPYAATSRALIGGMDISGAGIMCLSHLAMSGNASPLRYQLRRLRARLPANVPVLVGLWLEGEDAERDDRLRMVVGGDYFAKSLEEAVAACRIVSRGEITGREDKLLAVGA
jgi:predicted PurR-regulated permease PerM